MRRRLLDWADELWERAASVIVPVLAVGVVCTFLYTIGYIACLVSGICH
jgi:hypothetical protein